MSRDFAQGDDVSHLGLRTSKQADSDAAGENSTQNGSGNWTHDVLAVRQCVIADRFPHCFLSVSAFWAWGNSWLGWRCNWLCSVWQMMGLMCILLTTTCLFLLVLPWSRWCLRRNYFQVLLEDAILEQTEYLLTSESGKAAADAVTESLLTYSPPKTKPPSGLTNIPAKAKRTKVKKETFVSLKLKWQRVAHIAGSIIETLPNNAVNGDTAANAVCKHPKMWFILKFTLVWKILDA